MKGGREPIEGKYRTDLPGDLSLANPNARRKNPRVRQQAFGAPTSPQSGKKRNMKITEITNKPPPLFTQCKKESVKEALDKAIDNAKKKYRFNPQQIKELKKDLKNKSIIEGQNFRGQCAQVQKHVDDSVKFILEKRKRENAAIKIQRQVRSNKTSSGKKRRGSVGSKKRGPGKSCTTERLTGGLDAVLNDLKMKLDTSERRLVESAMRNAGKGAGSCNTVAVKKLFDGPPNIKNRAMTAYNNLGDNEGIKRYKTLKGAAEQRIKIADDKCLTMPETSLKKHAYCKNSNNPQVKSRLDKLKENLQSKIKEDQAKIAKAAEEKAEKDRQRQMARTNKNRKIKKCVADAQTLDTDAAKPLPIKPEQKIEELEPILADVSARYDKLKQECDEIKSKSRTYRQKRLMIQSSIATMQSAIKQKRRELAEKKVAEEKAKQEAELAKKKAEDARIAKEKADKEEKQKKIEAAKKAALLAAKLKKEAEAKKETARLKAEEERKKAEEAKKLADAQALKAEQERLKKEAAKKAAELEKKKKEEARIKAEQERKKAEEEAKKLKKEAAKKALLLTAKLETERKKKEEARQKEEAAKKALADKAAKEAKEKMEREAAEKEKKLKAEQDKMKKEQEKARKAMADEAAKAAREREAQKKKEEDKKAREAAKAEQDKQHKKALVAAKMQTVALQTKLEKMKKQKEENSQKLNDIQEQMKKLDEKVKQSNDVALKERADMIKKSLKNYTELLKA